LELQVLALAKQHGVTTWQAALCVGLSVLYLNVPDCCILVCKSLEQIPLSAVNIVTQAANMVTQPVSWVAQAVSTAFGKCEDGERVRRNVGACRGPWGGGKEV
jgi:hypothetical protein